MRYTTPELTVLGPAYVLVLGIDPRRSRQRIAGHSTARPGRRAWSR
jgi:hypothetical protein